MKKLSLLLLLGLLLLGVASCRHDQRPANVLDASDMADFLTDLYVVEGYYAVESQYGFEEASPETLGACDAVMEKHHLTKERVEKSFDYYSQHPEEYKAIQDEVASRIDKLSASAEALPQE